MRSKFGFGRQQSGSALLIVLALLGLISGLVMHVWFITSLQYDIMLQRELWHKKFYTTEMVLNVGLAQISQQFTYFLQQVTSSKKPYSIDLSHFVQEHNNDKDSRRAIVIVQHCNDVGQRDTLLVRALQLENKVCSCQLQCLLKKVEVCKQDGKETGCVASHFTIGAGV